MKLALAETNILWEDKQGNYGKLVGMLERLSIQDKLPELFALPEMSFTGFTMNIEISGESADGDGNYETVKFIKDVAKQYNTSIAFGWVKKIIAADEHKSSMAENHYTVVDYNGNIIFDYVKIHPFSYGGENAFFAGGNSLSFCDYKEFVLSAGICYDLRFPEIFQAMSKKASLIMVPANWPADRQEHFVTLCKARAIENQCYIAGINCRGKVGELQYAGGTALYSPAGKTVSPVDIFDFGEDTVSIYEMQSEDLDIRKTFPVKQDRKIELYRELL